MRAASWIAITLLGLAAPAKAGPGVPPGAIAEDATDPWSFSLSAYGYVVPDDRDYVQPTLTADRDWFHFEARHNYEDLDTGSAWLGYNFSAGEKLAVEFTPMIGGVFGQAKGVASGFRLSLDWRRLSFYSEAEYFIDCGDDPEDFIYAWSELTWSPWEWIRIGIVGQRTRLYESGLDIERGLLVGFSWRNVDFTTCVFNLGWEEPTVVLGVTVNF